MTRRIASIATSLVLAAALLAGCATGGGTKAAKGPSDQDLVKAGLNAYKAALMEKNVDKLMAVHSEKFKDSEGRSKAELKNFIADAISQGYLDNMKVDTDATTITVNGTSAVTAPVTLVGQMTISLSLSWEKEGADWKIVGITTS